MISRRCWSSTHSRIHSRGSRTNFKRAAVQILLQELMISILTGSYDCLCVCAPQCSCSKYTSSVLFGSKPFFDKKGTHFIIAVFLVLPLILLIVWGSSYKCMFSFCKILWPMRENYQNICARFVILFLPLKNNTPLQLKLQLQRPKNSSVIANFAWFLQNKTLLYACSQVKRLFSGDSSDQSQLWIWRNSLLWLVRWLEPCWEVRVSTNW